MKRQTITKAPMEACAIEAKRVGGKLHIQGLASVFDITDRQGDIMRRGAFTKTINERVKAGKVALMVKHIIHGGDVNEAIGTLVDAKETEIGFWFDAELFDTDLARETHGKIEQSPAVFGASVSGEWIGTTAIKDAKGNVTGLDIPEAKLLETTITMIPAVEQTLGTLAAKAEEQRIDQIEGRLAALESKAGVEAVGTGTKGAPDKAAPKAARRDYTENAARRRRFITIAEGEAE